MKPIDIGFMEEGERKQKEAWCWLIRISLSQPLLIEEDFIEEVVVAVNSQSGEIFLHQIYRAHEN